MSPPARGPVAMARTLTTAGAAVTSSTIRLNIRSQCPRRRRRARVMAPRVAPRRRHPHAHANRATVAPWRARSATGDPCDSAGTWRALHTETPMKMRSTLACRLSCLALSLAAGAGCTPTPSNNNPDGGSAGDDGGNPSSTPEPDAGTGSDAGTAGGSDAGTAGGNDAGSTGGSDAGIGGDGSTPHGGSPDAGTVMVPVMTPNGPTPPASLTGTTITEAPAPYRPPRPGRPLSTTSTVTTSSRSTACSR